MSAPPIASVPRHRSLMGAAAAARATSSADPLVLALAQLVRDRYAVEQDQDNNVVALRRPLSEGAPVSHAGRPIERPTG